MTISKLVIYPAARPRMPAVLGRSFHVLTWVIAGAFLMFSVHSVPAADSDLAGRFIESANKALAAGKLKEAEEYLDRAAAVAPQDERVRQARERVTAQKRAVEQARAEKQRARERVETEARHAKERGEEEARRKKEADKNAGTAAYNAGRFNEAHTLLRPLAEDGDASAQLVMGLLYCQGQGVSQDYTECVSWLRKAAEQGNAYAQNVLAARYCLGQGVRQDYTECGRWTRKAAEQGDADAQYDLGEMYRMGKWGVERDQSEAKKWYSKAAAQGHKRARWHLPDTWFK